MVLYVFEEVINNVLYYIIWTIELIGIGIIVFGTFYSIIRLIISKVNNIKAKVKQQGQSIKLVLANYLALGLEFMLAAEILKTVTINRDLTEIMILGAIIILRAAMSLLIYWELSYEEKKDVLIEKKKNRNSVKPL